MIILQPGDFIRHYYPITRIVPHCRRRAMGHSDLRGLCIRVWASTSDANPEPHGRAIQEEVTVSIWPNPRIAKQIVYDAMPGLVRLYAERDQQALLAKIRYNRLVDLFTGLTCHSLQSHYRSFVGIMGEVVIDELYVGHNRMGKHFVVTVRTTDREYPIDLDLAKRDAALCKARFPDMDAICLVAQLLLPDLIALFRVDCQSHQAMLLSERHYLLLGADETA